MTTETELARERLAADFRAIIADTEELLQATAGQGGEKAAAARERIQQRLRLAKEKYESAEAAVLNRARTAVRATDGYVHVHPWTTAGIAAGVGMLISVFELLADAREQVTSVNAHIEALKGFWLAETELQKVLGGKLPASIAISSMSPAGPEKPAAPDAASHSDPHPQHGKGN